MEKEKQTSEKIFQHTPPKKELDLKEYDERFTSIVDASGGSKRERAWRKAWEVRDFEIQLYWERAKYFWTFIAASFTAYFVVAGSATLREKFMELEFIVICIGFIFSFSWILVNKGSKVWQRNWEGHIDRLEEEFSGPLYRTVLKPDKSYSVTTLNLNVSKFITVIWLFLAIYYLVENKFSVGTTNINWWITAAIIITFYYVIKLWFFSKTKDSTKQSEYRIRKIN